MESKASKKKLIISKPTTMSDNDDEDYVPLKRSRIEKSNSTDTKSDVDDFDAQLRPVDDDKSLVYLANGYAVDSRDVLGMFLMGRFFFCLNVNFIQRWNINITIFLK